MTSTFRVDPTNSSPYGVTIIPSDKPLHIVMTRLELEDDLVNQYHQCNSNNSKAILPELAHFIKNPLALVVPCSSRERYAK